MYISPNRNRWSHLAISNFFWQMQKSKTYNWNICDEIERCCTCVFCAVHELQTTSNTSTNTTQRTVDVVYVSQVIPHWNVDRKSMDVSEMSTLFEKTQLVPRIVRLVGWEFNRYSSVNKIKQFLVRFCIHQWVTSMEVCFPLEFEIQDMSLYRNKGYFRLAGNGSWNRPQSEIRSKIRF